MVCNVVSTMSAPDGGGEMVSGRRWPGTLHATPSARRALIGFASRRGRRGAATTRNDQRAETTQDAVALRDTWFVTSFPPPAPPPGPPPPPGQPPAWGPGAPGPFGGHAAAEHPDGTTVLVLGILGLVVCAVLGPFAWKAGNKALREMDSRPDIIYSNRGSITTGRILGIVSTAFLIAGAVFGVIWLILAIAVFSGNA